MNSEKLKELEQSILGTPKEEAPKVLPTTPSAEGNSRMYVHEVAEPNATNDELTGHLHDQLHDMGYWGDPSKLRVVGTGPTAPHSSYPQGTYVHHQLVVEGPDDEMFDLKQFLVHGEYDHDYAYGVDPPHPRWSEVAGPESHPIHQAMQGMKDEIFNAGDDPINWERVGQHMDSIPDSVMKQNLDAELENLRDLEMSGEELGSSALSTHQAIDDLAAEHGLPIAKNPNPATVPDTFQASPVLTDLRMNMGRWPKEAHAPYQSFLNDVEAEAVRLGKTPDQLFYEYMQSPEHWADGTDPVSGIMRKHGSNPGMFDMLAEDLEDHFPGED